jgi:hypothetical protein
MVVSMRHWAKAVGVIDEKDKITELGTRLLRDDGWDPYLERTASLWLLHWRLASNPYRSTTWYLAFNFVSSTKFDRDFIADEITKMVNESGFAAVSSDTIRRDVECFIRTYATSSLNASVLNEDTLESPLAELELITPSHLKGIYEFNVGAKPSLPGEVFAFCLLEFWKQKNDSANTMTFERIAYEPGSPGRVFKLDENALTDYLLHIEDITSGVFRWSDAAGLRQVQLLRGDTSPYKLLGKAYMQ